MIKNSVPYLFITASFLFLFFFLITPDIGLAQDGCCVNPSQNCVGCGPMESSCMSAQTGACPNESPPADCPDEEGSWARCFVEGAFCFQTTNTVGVCQPVGCCQIAQGDCFQTSEGQCILDGFSYLGDGACQPQFDPFCSPLGCCQIPGMDPTSCQTGVTQLQCENDGGAWTEGVDCNGDFCGEPPPPTGCCQDETGEPACQQGITEEACGDGTWTEGNIMCDGDFCGEAPVGCCQTEAGVCNDTTEADCDGTFFEGGMCPMSGFCEPPPVGCCVCGENECLVTNEIDCSNMGCSYAGDNVSCSEIDECNIEPEGCCVLPENGALSVSNIFSSVKDNCVIETPSECSAQGGDYKGDGVSCADVPECQILPVRDVPTLGQWGMIVIAAFLGIYSLIALRNRNKLNVG